MGKLQSENEIEKLGEGQTEGSWAYLDKISRSYGVIKDFKGGGNMIQFVENDLGSEGWWVLESTALWDTNRCTMEKRFPGPMSLNNTPYHLFGGPQHTLIF